MFVITSTGLSEPRCQLGTRERVNKSSWEILNNIYGRNVNIFLCGHCFSSSFYVCFGRFFRIKGAKLWVSIETSDYLVIGMSGKTDLIRKWGRLSFERNIRSDGYL